MSNVINFNEAKTKAKLVEAEKLQKGTKPFWLIVFDGKGDDDDNLIFEGHQGHWADCFFSNATIGVIEDFCDNQGYELYYREMNEEELTKYPEAITFQKALIAEYGED